MTSSVKVKWLREFCCQNNLPFLSFDYAGCGESSGDLPLWSTDIWLQNVLDLIDMVMDQPMIFIGNSMGSYFMLMAGLLRPKKVHSLIGLASGFGSFYQKTQRTSIHVEGCTLEIGFDKARGHYINQDIQIDCPVRLIHGLNDDVVSYHSVFNIAKSVRSSDVQITLLKGENHKLRSDQVFNIIVEKIRLLRSE